MKSLVEFINESLISEALTLYLFKPKAATAQIAANFEDALRNFLESSKKEYSFNNKADLESFFKDFRDYAKREVKDNDRKILGVTDAASLANLIITNVEKLKEAGWKINKIKSFNESEREKKYKAWKKSDKYVEGKKFNKKEAEEESEDELNRIMVVYYVNDPKDESTTLEYEFTGKVNKDNQEQISMIKMDWHYATGLGYYDARPILLSNYLKKTDAELEAKSAVDDIIGKFD